MTNTNIAKLRAVAGAATDENERIVALQSLSLAVRMSDPREAYELALASIRLAEALNDDHRAAEGLTLAAGAGFLLDNERESQTQLERAQALYESLGDRNGALRAMGSQAQTLMITGEFERARNHYELALAEAEALDQRDLIAIWTIGVGSTYRSVGECMPALELFTKALSIAEQNNFDVAIESCHSQIGYAHHVLGDYDRAAEHFQLALALCGMSGNRVCLAESTISYCHVQLQLGQYGEVLSHAATMSDFYDEYGSRRGRASCRYVAGNAYNFLGEPSKALDCYQVALALYEELEDRQGIAGTIRAIGSICGQRGGFASAFDHQQRALRLYEELGDKSGIANTTYNLANVYLGLDDWTSALEYFRTARTLAETYGFRELTHPCLGGIGIAYGGMGQHAEAVEYFETSIAMAEQMADRRYIAFATADLGHHYWYLTEYERSSECLQTALAMAKDLGDQFTIAYATIELGRLYATAEFAGYDAARAEEYLIQSVKLATASGNDTILSRAHGYLAELFELDQQWHLAHHHYKLYRELYDSFRQAETHAQVSQLEHLKQIAELEKQQLAERAEAEIQRINSARIESDLSNATLQLLAQTQLLTDLRSDLLKIARKIPASEPGARELRDRVKNLPCQSVDWERFDRQFKAVHPEFIRRLTERAPDLTVTEVRICTMLRMDLKSQEMAQVFCISESGIEFHRKHIRKKLKLQREEKLPIVLGAM